MQNIEIRNLIVHGAPEGARVVLPKRKTLEQASNLSSVPPVFDAIPKSRRPYAVFESWPLWSAAAPATPIQQKEEVKPREEVKKPTTDLVLVRFDDQSNMAETMRVYNRASQRVNQYEKLIQLIARFDTRVRQGLPEVFVLGYEKDGDFKNHGYEVTPHTVDKLKHVAASFYGNELSKDGLSRELAKAAGAKIMLQEEAVVREAEQIIFESQRSKFKEIEVTKTEIKSDAKPASEKKKDETDAERIMRAAKAVEKLNDTLEKAIEDRANSDNNSKSLDLDKPGTETAAFFEELWNRPF